MPKATSEINTTAAALPSRRAFFGAALAMPVATVPVVMTVTENPDAELLAACREFWAAQADCDICNSEGWPDERCNAAVDRYWMAMEQVTSLRPTTAAGVLAKLDVAYKAKLDSIGDFSPGVDDCLLATLAEATGKDYPPGWDIEVAA